jgi:hypothetical protein
MIKGKNDERQVKKKIKPQEIRQKKKINNFNNKIKITKKEIIVKKAEIQIWQN